MTPVLRAVLVGQHPSGKNQIQMSAPAAGVICRFPKKSFEAWRSTGYAQLDRQRGAWPRLNVPGRIVVAYTKGDFYKRDVPGMIDALCHLLEWCPVHRKHNKKRGANCQLSFVADDVLLEDWVFEQLPIDRERPRLELTIEHKKTGA